MRKIFLNPQRGFTLIELMVVFTMVVIIAGLGFASFVSYSRKQAIEQEAMNLKASIEKVKFNSLSRVKPNGEACTQSNTLIAYQLQITSDNSFQINALCAGGSFTTVSNFKLAQNIVFKNDVLSCFVNYSVLSSTVVAGNCNGLVGYPANIEINGYGLNKIVKVDTAGNVNIQ